MVLVHQDSSNVRLVAPRENKSLEMPAVDSRGRGSSGIYIQPHKVVEPTMWTEAKLKGECGGVTPPKILEIPICRAIRNLAWH